MTQESGLGPTKIEVSERLSRVFENFMELGGMARTAAQYKDAATAFQLAANTALTIASIKEQPASAENNLSAGINFDDDDD